MKEAFLHYLWRLRRFKFSELKTTEGECLEIIHPGYQNFDSGPDFFNAQIKIDNTLWVGNVEIHVKSSDWIKHQHQLNEAYNNVILHVVVEEDEPILDAVNDRRIPCLELKSRIPPLIQKNYFKLQQALNWIPCEKQLSGIDPFTVDKWLERCLIERLQRKTELVEEIFVACNKDWARTFFVFLARGLGHKINRQPFQQLACSFPYNIIARHKTNLLQLEALLLGQAGFLETEFDNDYPNKLRREYQFLKNKYQLQALKKSIWKFSKLRPANFPTIRIAQLALLCHKTEHLLSKMLIANSIKDLENMFSIKLSNYWKDHYSLDKISSIKMDKNLGKTSIHILLINTIIPFSFYYGAHKNDWNIKEKAIRLLAEIPPEKNNIISKWENIGFGATNAAQSQALLELKLNYCDQKKCFSCSIGDKLLQNH